MRVFQDDVGGQLAHPGLNSSEIFDLAQLSRAAYFPSEAALDAAANLDFIDDWSPVTAELDTPELTASGASVINEYFFQSETYEVDPDADAIPGTAEAVVFENGLGDLALSFRGTFGEGSILGSGDKGDWLNRDRHYDAFSPFFDNVFDYIQARDVDRLLVTGHSLGGAMTEFFMEDYADGHVPGLSLEAVAFASPDASEANDSRVLNVGHEGDGVYSIAGLFRRDNSVENFRMVFDGSGVSEAFGAQHDVRGYVHSVGTILSSQFYDETERDSQVFVNYSDNREDILFDVTAKGVPGESQLVLGRGADPDAPSLPDIANGGSNLDLDDWLVGSNGDDWLEGFRGDDVLEGDSNTGLFAGGNDTMAGGEGDDLFLGAPEDLDGDEIVDLEIGDSIGVSGETVVADSIEDEAPGDTTVTFNTEGGLFGIGADEVSITAEIPTGAALRLSDETLEDGGMIIEVVADGGQDNVDWVSGPTSLGSAIADGEVATAEDAIKAGLAGFFGFDAENISYAGAPEAAFLTDDFRIDALDSGLSSFDYGPGIMLSSGGFPGPENITPGATVEHGEPGDPDLTATAEAVFSDSGGTFDASVMEFDVNVTDPGVDTLRASLVFGSEEFPEFVDDFVDIAAVYVNGVNYAEFSATGKPLSVISDNLQSGVFLDNDDQLNAPYSIEWDGFSTEISVRAPLEQGENTVKIGVADTGDSALDSGLFISDLALVGGGGTGGGALSVVTPDDNGTATASVAAEEFVLGTGAGETISGTAGDFDGDVVTGFDSSDSVTFLDTLFGVSDVTFGSGSVIMDIDTNADGDSDTNLTFAGQDDPESFVFSQEDGSTIIGLEDDPVVNEDPILTGNVTNAAGNPLSGLSLAINGETAATDASGAFTVSQGVDASGTLTASGGAPASTPDASDGAAIMRMAMGLSDPDEFELISADVDRDGAVTAADAQAVYKDASGLASDGQVGEYILLDADADYSGANLADTGYSGGVDIPALTDDLDVSLIALQLGQTDQFDFA